MTGEERECAMLERKKRGEKIRNYNKQTIIKNTI
jgi:hypothetical protein